MGVKPFKKCTDNPGNVVWDWKNILEKLITTVVIILVTSFFTSYMTIARLEWRVNRIESAVVKIGKTVWAHISPGTPCPFDEFDKEKR